MDKHSGLLPLFVFSPKPLTSIEDSHVYRMLQDNQEQPPEPRQSGSFKALQDYVESDGELPSSVIWGNSDFTRQKLQLAAQIKMSKFKCQQIFWWTTDALEE